MDNYCSRVGQLVDRDRTQFALKVAKENAEKAAEQARAASRAKTEFLAKMSHEIRTPMNGVLGMTDLLLRTDLTDRQFKFVNIAHHSAETLLNIINDILDFSKIEAGKLSLDNTDFDIFDTVGDAIELLAEPAQNKGLELVYGFSTEVPQWLRGDPIRLRQIIFNLVGNGIKFTDRGEVVVRVSADEVSEESIVLSFEIRDTGIGIEPGSEEQILEPFEQADGTITRRFGGTGLGLPIARQLIEMMGGTLSIESASGKGSKFHFTIRLKTAAASHDQERCQQWNLPNLKVLVAGDNAACRDMLGHHFSNWGMATEAVPEGRQALETLRAAASRSQPFDLALLDLSMSDMSGIEVARVINADAALAVTRVIVLATIGQHGDLEAAKGMEDLAFLTKPVRQSELHSLIKLLMSATRDESPSVSERADQAESPSLDQEPTFGAAILLAEDNLVNQEVTREYLKTLGCRTDVVATGLEALAALDRTSYDLVLMDCQMPEMDGLEATAMMRLREQQQNQKPRTPVIAITANAFEGERQRCLEAGMDDYISKPFNRDELQVILQRWFNRQRSSDDTDGDVDLGAQSA
jgi:CheY-like chemotaxis protein